MTAIDTVSALMPGIMLDADSPVVVAIGQAAVVGATCPREKGGPT